MSGCKLVYSSDIYFEIGLHNRKVFKFQEHSGALRELEELQMQLQKEKKHLQKTIQELELAKKVQLLLLFVLVLDRLPMILVLLAVFNVSRFVLRTLILRYAKGKTSGFLPIFLCRADVYTF